MKVRFTSSTVISDDDNDGRRLTFGDLTQDFTYEIEGIDRSKEGTLEALNIHRGEGKEAGFTLQQMVTAKSSDSGFRR